MLTAIRHLSLVFVLLAGSASPALADRAFDDLARSIRQLVDEQRLPSVVVAVARDGRIVWEEAFGWADRERRVPAGPHVPYSLASISKPFTASAIMKLVESGHVALDRPANDYLGEARISGGEAAGATVRRVLSHTAGLSRFYLAFDGSAPPVDEIIGRYAILNGLPGRRYEYSNLGYGILERIIERASGLRYEEFLHREILAPLGLASASVPLTVVPQAAARYAPDDRPLAFYDLGHRGASSVFASAHDLVRFGMFHLASGRGEGDAVLSRRSIAEMQRVQTPGSRARGYGLGWSIDEPRPGVRHVGHTGGMPGVSTVLSLYPAERVVIVVLANKRTDATIRLAQRIAARMMPLSWRMADD